MTDRPMLFSAPMIRALLDGRKTQTRRTIKPTPKQVDEWNPDLSICPSASIVTDVVQFDHPGGGPYTSVPLRFAIGDRLWVKETWRANYGLDFYRDELGRCPRPSDMDPATTAIEYLADGEHELGGRTRVSIHMPRWASRLTLTVADVRVERLQDCSEGDAKAEGVEMVANRNFRAGYAVLWNSINGAGAWEANPWVVAVTFTVEQRNIDA